MEIVQACDGQLLYRVDAAPVQRKVISFGPVRKEKTADDVTVTPLTVSPPSVPLPPPPFLFPGQEVRFTMSSCFLRTQSS